MSIRITYPFTNASNYTYDTDEIAVSGGKAALNDQRPTDATFGATYSKNDTDASWGDGSLTGTDTGSPDITGGKLDLTLNGLDYVDYDADLNADHQQTGAIKLKITPEYNGTPGTNKTFFSIAKANGDATNAIVLKQVSGTGQLTLTVKDQNDSSIISANLGAWSPVSDTEYEFELNWDITTGATRLFIDGTQFGTTQTATGTRSADIALFRVGSNVAGSETSEFFLDDIVVFSTVQHTANYTAGYTLPATIYSKLDPIITFNATFRQEALEGFTQTATISGDDQVKYILSKNGSFYYWTGSAWAVSNGTYAQSNTAAEIETNKATFTTSEVTTQIKMFLHSDDGSTTPEVDQVDIDYDFFGATRDSITTTIVYGYQVDSLGTGDTHPIKIMPNKPLSEYKTNVQMTDDEQIITPRASDGYWEVELIRTLAADFDETVEYVFDFGGKKYRKTLPSLDSVAYNSL